GLARSRSELPPQSERLFVALDGLLELSGALQEGSEILDGPGLPVPEARPAEQVQRPLVGFQRARGLAEEPPGASQGSANLGLAGHVAQTAIAVRGAFEEDG